MILPSTWIMRHREMGLYLELHSFRQNGYIGREPHFEVTWWLTPDDHRAIASETQEWWPPYLARFNFDPDLFEMVRGVGCGCCGTRYGLRIVGDHGRIWRCEKHVGRSPCCIEGCGRTFAIDDGGYRVRYICGTHWRMAPKKVRDHVSLLRKRAKRLDWPDKLWHQYCRMFEMGVRYAQRTANGDIDQAEIDRMFGW